LSQPDFELRRGAKPSIWMTERTSTPWNLCALLLAATVAAAPRADAGRVAPDCTLRSVAETQTYALKKYQGQVLWVDFWASWCGPCVDAVPFLNDLDRDFRARGLNVIGINLDEDPQDALDFTVKHPTSFAQAADAQGDCPRNFGVEAMPSSYLIDRQGVIRHVHVGFQAGEVANIRALVDQVLAEPAESPTPPVGEGNEGARAGDR
jgi:thiol-disulfide isomerase/thioredoxin